jgi:hypothetical protein
VEEIEKGNSQKPSPKLIKEKEKVQIKARQQTSKGHRTK